MSELSLQYFTEDEFNCSCCGGNEMNPEVMELADEGRGISGIPWVITSAWRCPAHNEKIGSKSDVHMKGLAIDVSTPDSRTRYLILAAMLEIGFDRIGIGEDFIHGDMDHTKDSMVIWDYYG